MEFQGVYLFCTFIFTFAIGVFGFFFLSFFPFICLHPFMEIALLFCLILLLLDLHFPLKFS